MVISMKKRTRMALALTALLGAAGTATAADGFHWGNVAIGGGGFVSAIVPSTVEKNLFYARTDVGGAYRWDESAKKWVSMMDWVNISERGLLGVEAIAVDPKTPGKVYMMTGTVYWNQADDGIGRSAFLRSSDHGKTWEKIYTWDNATKWFNAHGNGMGRGNGEALAIDPNDPAVMFYGSKNKGLFKSTDNGTTWKHVDGFTTVSGADTTWNGAGFSFVSFAPGSSTVLHAGFLREENNVFRSEDAGKTWTILPVPASLRTTAGGKVVRLMPQRSVTTAPDTALYVTFADGAGPHTQAWSESWGAINDGFGRGAILKYSFNAKAWSDVSPEDFIDEKATGASKYDSLNVAGAATNKASYEYLAPYGGISINPSNPLEMVSTSMGYRGSQFWQLDSTGKKWKDQWGSNIYHTVDGGKTWVKSFQYYWMEGGVFPASKQMDENGIGWLFNSSIHWSGSVVMDPFNPKRVFVSSGNGIYMTDDVTDYTFKKADCGWCSDELTQRQLWKVASHGIEEVVPEEVVSIPGGPVISIIGDYDGFRHDDVTKFPSNRHLTSVSGTKMSLGSTRALAYAPKSGKLVKVADARGAQVDAYSNVPISALQFSSDSGRSWTVESYTSLSTAYTKGRSVALSTDGAVALWTPGEKSGSYGEWPVHRYYNSAWTTVAGIDGAWVLGDPEEASTFYAFKNNEGDVYRSTDKGATFAKVGTPGKSSFRKMRATPGATGDLWVPVVTDATTGSLMRSKDGGATWTAVAGVGRCEAVGFGKAAIGATFPAIFVYATIDGVEGVFQSDDEGKTWTRINDDAHEYGGLANGEFVMGDMNTYGIVYMSTAGNGIAARLGGEGGTTAIGKVKSVAAGLTQASIRKQGGSLSFSGLPQGTSVEILTLQGRRVSQQIATSSELKIQLPSSSLHVVRLKAAGQVRDFLR
jgi:hypothetical protein